MNYGRCPHDHQDEAEVPALDAVRRRAGDALGTRLTPVPFIIKAVLRALQAFPRFNASLPPDGNGLVMKRYFHIGVAVETPNSLVVPVIRDYERKSLGEIAAELADKAERARTKELSVQDCRSPRCRADASRSARSAISAAWRSWTVRCCCSRATPPRT